MVLPADPGKSAVVKRMSEFKKDLIARDADTIYHMGNRWLQLEGALEANIQLLATELSEVGQEVNMASVFRNRRYQSLLSQMQAEMDIYNIWADDYISENQQKLGVLGIQHASETIQLSLIEGGVGAGRFFDKLPIEAIELMVGNAGDGGPLYTLLQEAYPAAVEQMTTALIENIGLGIGPYETAKAMTGGVESALTHALTVARTEMLRVYREASRQQYETSGAVKGYRRFASKSGNTCALCFALDGEIYKTSDLMSVHPNDRCTMIPVVRGVPELEWESGEDWLRRQDSELQEQVLGKGAFEMWDKGEIELMDLVKKTEHPIWGPSLQRNTLDSLKGKIPTKPPTPDDLIDEYKNFSDLADMDKWGKDNYATWIDNLSEKEKSILLDYKLGGSDEINGVLRFGDEVDERIQASIDAMNQALGRTSALEDITVFRGGTLPPVKAGSTIIDQGFMSTTLSRTQAESFINYWGYQPEGTIKSVFEIRVPKGTPGAFLDSIGGEIEREFLLPAGTNLKVLEVTKVGDTQYVILEVLK